jgi:AcrR family transcriptional regulator
LLEVAGQVFAEKGFEAATAKEICEQARTNTAAVNYYFGGIEGLYTAVIEEAGSRLVGSEAVPIALEGKADAKDKLEAILGEIVRAATGPLASSWVVKVLGREVVAPSFTTDLPREKEAKARRMAILRTIVAELMGLPPDHPAVSRGCVSVLASCWMLLVTDRRMLKTLFPDFDLTPENAPALTRHMVEFALGGLAAVAR